MGIKIQGLQFASSLAGLENYENDSFSFSVSAHMLASGGVSRWATSWPINNSNAISGAQLQYSLDNVWRLISGALVLYYNSNQYEVETVTYYSGSNFVVETYVVNLIGSALSIPQFNVNIAIALFNAPF